MSLQLILGNSGAGKSFALREYIIKEAKKQSDMNYFVIVPEQFTMQTQKDYVLASPRKGIMNIDILSFMRLAYRIFDENGCEDRTILEDTGKSMLIRKVVEQEKDKLVLIKNSIKKQGFIDELKSLLSEIFQYSITKEQLEEMIEIAKEKPLLQKKLEDMVIIYNGFRNEISGKYRIAEEILDAMEEIMEQSQLLKNAVICLDGFTGFTPSQNKVLKKLVKLCKKVIVTITIDTKEDYTRVDEEFKLFHLSKKTIKRLLDIAAEQGVEIEKPYIIQGENGVPYRFLNRSGLVALERYLFRYPQSVYPGKQEEVSLHCSKTQEGEVSFTIKEIKRLVRQEGYRYGDIAVVTGNLIEYARIIEIQYEKASIPFFIDQKKGILNNAMVELIRSALAVIRQNFDYESVFRYLRCGIVTKTNEEEFQWIKDEDVDNIENYVRALGIKGYKKWNSIWDKTYKKEEDLEQLNLIRRSILEPFHKLREGMKGKQKTVLEYTKTLHDFLIELRVYESIEKRKDYFSSQGKSLLEKEYSQMYGIVLDTLDQLVELLGEEEITFQEYEQMLETGFAEAKVGLIPPGVDQVLVGDIERTRLDEIKALFFIGVNDGTIPKANQGGGILSDLDRELLVKNKIELAPTVRQNAYTEHFYLYLNMTKPKERLYLTYTKIGRDGKNKSPSYLIGKMQKIFPDLQVKEECNLPIVRKEEVTSVENAKMMAENILGADKGKGYLLEGLRNFSYEYMAPQWEEVFAGYFRDPNWKEPLKKLIEGSSYVNQEDGISKAVAQTLYGKELNNSVTRVERYAACAFAHFMSYGLQLKERQEFVLRAPDMGNIFHNTLERFSKTLKERKQSWQTLTVEMQEQLVEECLETVIEEYGAYLFEDTQRNAYMKNRIARITKRTIWALCQHIKQGKFEPLTYEQSFSFMDGLESVQMALSEEESIRLYGRIDRVDTYEDEEGIYVKVIDYKSGNTAFELEDFYYGLQLQLVVYYNAATELLQRRNDKKGVIPAGIFYYHITDPLVEKDSGKDPKNQILKELKMNGLINKEAKVLQLLDKDFGTGGELNPSVKSNVVSVETTKDGAVGKRSAVAEKEQFSLLSNYAKEKIRGFGKEILDGNTKIAPYQLGERTPCTFCNYEGICGFDKKLPGNQYRKLKELSKEEVWDKLRSEEDGDR